MTLPQAAPPCETPTPPKRPLPKGACDAHVHLLGDDFPLWDRRVEDPAPGGLDDWLARYRTHLAALGCTRGVIVHSILYGTDLSVTKAAVAAMGTGFTGVGLITDDATEADLDELVAAGLKAVRLNYVHGGVLSWAGAKRLAPALAERGLHIEMLAHAHSHLEELAADVRALPCDLVFDHMAWPDTAHPAAGAGLAILETLLKDRACWTKLSAPYRFSATPQALYRRLIEANPDRCLWGSDWPHIMLAGVPTPDAGVILNGLIGVTDAAERQAIFVDNPERLYRF